MVYVEISPDSYNYDFLVFDDEPIIKVVGRFAYAIFKKNLSCYINTTERY